MVVLQSSGLSVGHDAPSALFTGQANSRAGYDPTRLFVVFRSDPRARNLDAAFRRGVAAIGEHPAQNRGNNDGHHGDRQNDFQTLDERRADHNIRLQNAMGG
jgi:hypothetical protein